MPVIVVPVIVFVLRDILAIHGKDLKSQLDLQILFRRIWMQRSYWLTLILMAGIPIIVGSLWTRHADLIKERSVFTAWHTSKAMVNWYFGTWALRTDQRFWINTISEAVGLFLPYGLSLLALFGLFLASGMVSLSGETREIRLFILSILASLVIVLAIFLSLYQQQYYFISFSASMAILGGYGLSRLLQFMQQKGHVVTFVFAIWVVIFLAFNVKDYKADRNIAAAENRKLEKSLARSQRVQKYVPLEDWVVVVEYDWDPSYVYPLQRKAMVVTPRELGKPVCQVLADERFTLVVVADRGYARNEELLNYALQCFKSRQEVLPGVFVVAH